MNFPSMIKERIRLIKPSRPQAPTEYNLQYKNWTVTPFTYDTFRVINSQKKVEEPLKIDDKEISNNSSSTGYPASTDASGSKDSGELPDEAPCTKADSMSVEPPTTGDAFAVDYDLASTLRATQAKFHTRPANRNRPAGPKSTRSFSQKNERTNLGKGCPLERYREKYVQESPSQTPVDREISVNAQRCKEAWAPDGERGLSPKRENLTRKDSNASTSSTKINKKDSDHLRLKDLYCALENVTAGEWERQRPESADYLKNLPSQDSMQNVASDSIIQMKPFDHTPMSQSKQSRRSCKLTKKKPNGDYRRRRPYTVGGVDEASLRKLYENLSTKDLKQLHESYKGPGRASRCPTKLNDEDLKMFRQAAMRSSTGRSRPFKDWETSYSTDYKYWSVQKGEESRESTPKVKTSENYKPEDISDESTSKSPTAVSARKEEEETEERQEEEEEREEEKDPAPENAAQLEKEKKLEEASKMEELEFESLFGVDGKPKLETYTSSSAFKPWPVNKPETPIWGNKTMVSIGSGHWNLPLNKNEDWKLSSEATSKRESEKQRNEKTRASPAYKIRVSGKQDENLEANEKSSKQPAGGDAAPSDPFIAMYYPDRRTNSTYLTEYMRKFHRLPIQRKWTYK